MEIKVMSFNLRYHNEGDGENAFFKRIDRCLNVISEEKPDIIGFQEVTDDMRLALCKRLTDYVVIGCGRGRDYTGESMVIAFLPDTVSLIGYESVWLSATPTVPGSTYGGDQSFCPRMYASALFKHRLISEPFRFINTHLDHCGKNARFLGSMQLVQAISQYKEKFIMTGDFNALPDTPEIKLITSALSDIGCVDCSSELEPTFHEFGKRTGDKRIKIDYIFSNGACKKCYSVIDRGEGGLYYSDHNAICALISLD